MDFKIQWRRENRAADPAAVIKIKKVLKEQPELLENDTITINPSDCDFIERCADEYCSKLQTLKFGYDPELAIRCVVSDWEQAELEVLGLRQVQNW
jgi:hypothetical protein